MKQWKCDLVLKNYHCGDEKYSENGKDKHIFVNLEIHNKKTHLRDAL